MAQSLKDKYLATTQQVSYDGNTTNYYPYFDMFPTGDEENITEDNNTDVLIYDGGNVDGWK